MMRIALALLLASFAFCQNAERVFRLTHTLAATGQQEIATTLRVVAQIQKLSVDAAATTVTVQGSAAQIALAEWLVPRLDAGIPAPQSYNVAGDPNDIILVYPLSHVGDNIMLQEIITTIRTVVSLQWVYNITSTRTLALRGNANQIAAISFLLPRLDTTQAEAKIASPEHFHVNGEVRGVDTLTVYPLRNTKGAHAIQEVITNLRAIAELQRVYSVSSTSTLAMQASQSEIQVSEWLLGRLDREGPDPASNELKLPGGKDDLLHVFYLSHITAPKDIAELSKTIVPAAQVHKAFHMTAPPAIIVRGTADSVALAGRLIAQADNPDLDNRVK